MGLVLGWLAVNGCATEADDDGGSGSQCTAVAGAGEPVQPSTPQPHDPGSTLRAGVFVGSCVPDDGIEGNIGHFYRVGSFRRVDVSCFEGKANGCGAVKDCMGMTADLQGPCEESCRGGRYEACDDQLHFTMCCASMGMECSTESSECVYDDDAPTCSPGSHMATCVDGHPETCLDGHVTPGPDCAAWGMQCGTSPLSGEAVCVGAGPACDEQSSTSAAIAISPGLGCDGAMLRLCMGGREHSLDCSMVGTGFTCQSFGGASFCGLASECDPDAFAQSCDGTSITLCHVGRVEQVSCTELGFTGCQMVTGKSAAVCVPSPYSG